jgi:surface protein
MVKNMSAMFQDAISFNGNISSWDTFMVKNMSAMFRDATSFNKNISSWNTVNVTNMDYMFFGATKFSYNISNWIISNNPSHAYFNSNPSTFYTPFITKNEFIIEIIYTGTIPDYTYINNPILNNDSSFFYYVMTIDTTYHYDNKIIVTIKYAFYDNMITNDGLTFNNNTFFQNNSNISNINIKQFGNIPFSRSGNQLSNLLNLSIQTSDTPRILPNTSFNSMFKYTKFNIVSSPINSWAIYNVIDMTSMFQNSWNFNAYINDWILNNVKSMKNMFNGSMNTNPYFVDWELLVIQDMSYMFANSNFNGNIKDWKISSNFIGINMEGMFKSTSLFNQPLNTWNVWNVSNMNSMFESASLFNQPLNTWNVNTVTHINFSNNSVIAIINMPPFH